MLLHSRKIFQGKIVTLNLEDVQLPDGTHSTLEIVHHPGGAAVVAIDAQRQVCLLRQFRHAVGGWIWELPAGKLEPNEPPELTARRELQEEAGVDAAHWQSLGQYVSSPGILTERVHLFLATQLAPAQLAREQGEVMEVHWVDFDAALRRVHSGDIEDGKTGLGLFKAAEVLRTQAGRD